jgi:hypothetical protein
LNDAIAEALPVCFTLFTPVALAALAGTGADGIGASARAVARAAHDGARANP